MGKSFGILIHHVFFQFLYKIHKLHFRNIPLGERFSDSGLGNMRMGLAFIALPTHTPSMFYISALTHSEHITVMSVLVFSFHTVITACISICYNLFSLSDTICYFYLDLKICLFFLRDMIFVFNVHVINLAF